MYRAVKDGINEARVALANDGIYSIEDIRNGSAFAFHNEFGLLGVVIADHAQDAYDEAADTGILNSECMDPEDHAEHVREGWTDSFIYAGNESQAYWNVYLVCIELDPQEIFEVVA